MKTTDNTVLITGGSAGIGFEIAKLFSQKGNRVIITGRDEDKLTRASALLTNSFAIKADISKEDDVDALIKTIRNDFPELNVVVNNAGRALLYNLADDGHDAFAHAQEEMLTNYLSVIRLNQRLLPFLKEKDEAAIVNVSSIVAYVPGASLPTYAASKAALHSYTTSLRLSLADTKIKVFELMPPLVDTSFSAEIGGQHGIKPEVVANGLFMAFRNDEFEIRVGDTARIYELFLSSPQSALDAMNADRRERMSD